MARFFIDRPIFAWVIAIIIMLAGALTIPRLPIARYPTIAPPTVSINASYPGASAQVVEDSVTHIIEQNMKALAIDGQDPDPLSRLIWGITGRRPDLKG